MPHQIKGKSFLPKILAIHLEIVKIVPKSEQNPDDEPPKQYFQVFLANPQAKHKSTTDNTKQA